MSEHRKYRKFTAKQKLEIVLASLRGDRSIAELCREHDIAESLLRKWRDQALEACGVPKVGSHRGIVPICRRNRALTRYRDDAEKLRG